MTPKPKQQDRDPSVGEGVSHEPAEGVCGVNHQRAERHLAFGGGAVPGRDQYPIPARRAMHTAMAGRETDQPPFQPRRVDLDPTPAASCWSTPGLTHCPTLTHRYRV